jgi:acyl-CoA hydrolase
MNTKKTLTYRRHVKNEDLNAAGSLFGGRLMEWCDEAAALYSFCQMKTKKIVTLKVSELTFKEPTRLGDILEFYAYTVKEGTSSFTLKLEVFRKTIGEEVLNKEILSCEMVFVAVDDQGKPTQWKKS